MGFYGNITNTSNTTFQFDRIYPNRLAMDANANNDGIFIGRYVLVEYQEDAAYPIGFGPEAEGNQFYFYASPNLEQATKIKYLGESNSQPGHLPSEEDIDKFPYEDGFYKTEILQFNNNEIIEFYQCKGGKDGYALFAQINKEDITNTSQYIQNFAIDEKHYGQASKGFKGYDSTVWVKASAMGADGKLITKYVNIADLNSVVPTFDIAADAPTMTPITPHFDADSTNVYYKLHMQSPYGFRVKQGVEGQSDDDTIWYKTTYNKKEDETKTEIVYDGPADIYYNQAGFNPETPSKVSNKAEDNYIKLEPTGESGAIYAHDGQAKDIQEFSLHLPAIGNMMSDAWDIIHGSLRNDDMRQYLTNEEGKMLDKEGNITEDESKAVKVDSLQGRLNSIAAIEKNQIPIKRINNGQLVGTKINGNKHSTITDNFDASVIKDAFTQDDAWIKTQVNADNTPNAISIHHTFNSTPNSISQVDKNDNTKNQGGENYKEAYLEDKTNVVEEHQDKIKLYVPYVDATGHVVGKNIETITLPYGYKTITTNGRGEDTEINTFDKVAAKTQNIIAENTQDELAINSGNEWIRIDTDANNDILTISHDIHKTSSDSHDTDWTQTEANTTIPTTTYEFDNAGHYVCHHTENYKLPFGYGKIVGDSGSTEATATFDELTISTDDNWIATSVSDDQVNITHTGPVVTSVTNKSNIVDPNFGSTFTIEDWYFDAKGHKHTGKTHTVQFPKGSLNDLTATGSSVLTGISMNDDTGDITQQNANVGTLTLTEYTQGQSGRLTISDTNTINGAFKGIQDYINTLDMSNTSSTQFITKITQIDGQVAVERAAAGTLQLGTPSTDGTIPENSSLNNAFNITNTRFKTNEDALAREVQDRKDAITKEINDRNSAISSAISAIVDKDDDGTINKLAEVIEWINNNPSTATQMQKAIQDNTKAISDEANLARSEEGKIATALTTETGRAIAAELGLQEQIDALGTAAQKDIEDFATATQGTTAETTAATIATYGDIVTYNAEDFVLKSEYNALLSDFNELKALVEQLNNQINPPQQPDNSGEIV